MFAKTAIQLRKKICININSDIFCNMNLSVTVPVWVAQENCHALLPLAVSFLANFMVDCLLFPIICKNYPGNPYQNFWPPSSRFGYQRVTSFMLTPSLTNWSFSNPQLFSCLFCEIPPSSMPITLERGSIPRFTTLFITKVVQPNELIIFRNVVWKNYEPR